VKLIAVPFLALGIIIALLLVAVSLSFYEVSEELLADDYVGY